MSIDDFLDLLEGVKQYSGGFKAICPAHEDREASLGIREGEDHEILLKCYSGCETKDVLEAMDLTFGDLFPGSKKNASMGEPESVYTYTDEEGNPLFESVRFHNKQFRQRHKLEDGTYSYHLENVRRVLYRLPEVLEAARNNEVIYLVEGEKDADALRAIGLKATTNPMGAGKWKEEYSQSLIGVQAVVIIQDKDDPGRRHAIKVRDELRLLDVSVIIVEAKEGKDASDHLDAGYEPGEFQPVVERVRRGIVTAREMADNAAIHLTAREGSVAEYLIWDIMLGRLPLALRPGRPYLFGGYTGDGKSTLGLQMSRGLCSSAVPPRVGYFTNEMSADDLRNRFITHWGLDLYKIEHPWEMDDSERYRYTGAVEQMKEWPLEIIYDTGLTSEMIDTVTRDRDYDVIFVDHIHRFAWGAERRVFESEIAKLTNLALDYNIPVCVFAQLRATRMGGQFETYPRPNLATFKETSVLGEEAAMAVALWRHRLQDSSYDPTGLSEFIVLKNRYGPTLSAQLKMDASTMTFKPFTVTEAVHAPLALDVPDTGADERPY